MARQDKEGAKDVKFTRKWGKQGTRPTSYKAYQDPLQLSA